MKTIKIFLASSEELKNDRVSFGNFIRELDKRYRERGIYIDLYTWEGADGAYNGRRKQDEYNDNVRDSDMLVALFYIKAGGFTQEEFHEAVNSFEKTGKPKVYVYFRQLEDESKITKELNNFKKELEGQDSRGHFAFRYNNDDSLHLDFVMQLLLLDKIKNDELNVEDGQVMLNGMVIAQMDSLQFATDNKGNQELINELEKRENELNEIRQALDQNPNIDFIKKQYNIKLEEYKQKKEELEKHQNNLLNTAIRIANIQKGHISDATKRAIEAFNSGDATRADYILDEAENSARFVREQLHIAKEVAFEKIEQLIFAASVKMSNTAILIDDRIEQTCRKYEEAISLAKEAGYDQFKYAELLEIYGDFLQDHEKYENALDIRKELIEIRKRINGEVHIQTAISYTKLGSTLDFYGQYDESLNILQIALNTLNNLKDDSHLPEFADVYNNLGNVYNSKGKNEIALEWHQKALDIRLKIGKESFDTARSYHNIGIVLNNLGKKEDAIQFFKNSIKIKEKLFKEIDKRLAKSYYGIAQVYFDLGMYNYSINYMFKLCKIYEESFGIKHSKTLSTYYEIARIYYKTQNYDNCYNWTYKAAIQGYVEALFSLGFLYKEGKGVDKNSSMAIEWYNKAKEKDYNRAQYNIGCMYLWGESVDIDYLKAFDLFFESAKQGYASAQCNLGYMFELGKGIKQDYTKALYWYQKAAEQEDSTAQNNMGIMYEYGKGVDKNYVIAAEWYQKSADNGYSNGQVNLGLLYEGGNGVEKDYYKASNYYRMAAEQGNEKGQCYLGVMYEYGKGVEKDYEKAFQCYLKSAEQGFARGQYYLATMFANGKGVNQNYKETVKWLYKAAEQDNDDAEYNLGWLYQKGEGVEIDYSKAIKWYQKAAGHGNDWAQTNLGFMYENGLGVEINYSIAFEWYQKAAKSNNSTAQYNIGNLYENGKGVEKDYDKAIEWYKKSIEQGFEKSYNGLAWVYHLIGNYEEALLWAEKATTAFPDDPDYIDTLATVFQGLGRHNEAMVKYELCLKLYKGKENLEGIKETEEKIAALKELMNNG